MNRQRLLIIIFLFLPLFIPDIARAQRASTLDVVRWEQAQRYRFYGGIELSYRNYKEELDGILRKDESIFEQRYGLGLSGYIWRPKLIIFSSDISFVINNQDPKNDYKSLNFGFNSVIFPKTRFPLILHAGRSTNTFDGYLGSERTGTTTSYGIRWGYATLRNTKLILGYSHTNSETEGGTFGDSSITVDSFILDLISFPYVDRRKLYMMNNSGVEANSNVSGNADSNAGNSNNSGGNAGDNSGNAGNVQVSRSRVLKLDLGFQLTWGLTYEFLRYKTEDGFSSSDDEKSHRLRIFATRGLFNLFTAYTELALYKTGDVKNVNFLFDLTRQTQKYYTYNNYNFTRDDDGRNVSTRHTIRTQNTYWYSRNLVFNAGLSYNRFTPERSDSYDLFDMHTGVSYSRYFTSYVMQAYLSTGYNSSSLTDNYYAINYGLRIESMPKITRFLTYKYSGEFSGSYSSDEESINRFELKADAMRSFRLFTLTGAASINYSISSVKGGSRSTGVSLDLTTGVYARLSRYATLNLSATYNASRSSSNISSYSLTLSESLSFVLYRNLNLSVGAIQGETSSDGYRSRYYEIHASLDYRLRKVFLHGEYNISDQDDNGTILRKRTIYLRLSRPI